MRYGHITLNQWNSLPQGEEVLTFALQEANGRISTEDILKFPGERERKGWVEERVRGLADMPEPVTLFHDSRIESLLFEIVNFDPSLPIDHISFLPQDHLQASSLTPSAQPLALTVEQLRSEANALLAHRKRSLKTLQIARGELRWVEVFTDGSFMRRTGQGGAAFIRDDGAYGALRFSAENSNEPELVAALIAIASARGGEKVSINSDSKNVVRTLNSVVAFASGRSEVRPVRVFTALEGATLDALVEVVSQGHVRARWVRGHCGNRMNDGADRLAKAVRKRKGFSAVPSARGIAHEATGVSAPVSYGFSPVDLAVPDWYGKYLMNGEIANVQNSCESQFDGPSWAGASGGAGWLVRGASA